MRLRASRPRLLTCCTCAGKGGYEQQEQAQAWQAYTAWERENAQALPPQQLASRVALAYECALTVLQHFPEVRPQ